MIHVTWKLSDGTTGSAEFTDDRLDEVIARVAAKFGSPKDEIPTPAPPAPYRGRERKK